MSSRWHSLEGSTRESIDGLEHGILQVRDTEQKRASKGEPRHYFAPSHDSTMSNDSLRLSKRQSKCQEAGAAPNTPHDTHDLTTTRPLTASRNDSEKRANLRRSADDMRHKRRAHAGYTATKRLPPFRSLPHLPAESQNRVSSTSVDQSNRSDGRNPLRDQDTSKSSSEHDPEQDDDNHYLEDEDVEEEVDFATLQREYKERWILNLSMHFCNKSNREKFFVTYAQEPALWRRLTISIDYRDAVLDSLEDELSELPLQRDKSFRIFESLRESLPNIKFFPTVTNLKLETTPDGQLHVHVREDTNEIIDYPKASLLEQVNCRSYSESELQFYSHISGFVYKVRVEGRILIKKEIPGPDTIDEFLYEVNALAALHDSPSVIQLQGLITSNDGSVIKGLLISYAERGALVDVLYDWELPRLPVRLRLQWAREIIKGLSDIHEAGFVQGDFTLSNIVIDERYQAHIIDINRRGCPIGWEPPELARLIDQGQRISMYIGVKTDMFQLGMVLWALAAINDEPEREDRPLPPLPPDIPSFYQKLVLLCMVDRPQARPSAAQLLRLFEAGIAEVHVPRSSPPRSHASASERTVSHRSDREYIDPALAVTLNDTRQAGIVAATGRRDMLRPPSSSYRDDGSATYPNSRGRSAHNSWTRRRSTDGATEATSISPASSPISMLDDECPSSYPTAIREEDLDVGAEQQLYSAPPFYHRIQHADSGFDEKMVETLESTAAAGASNLDEIKEVDSNSSHDKHSQIEKDG